MRSPKRREGDRELGFEQHMNPFARNRGMAGALKNLGVDRDNPDLEYSNFDWNIDESLENLRDNTKEVRKLFKADEEEIKMKAKRKMVMKNMFGKEKSAPALLTWMEKEMIRYLHKKDPLEWNHQRLSESFPATTEIIHKVLRSNTLMQKDRVEHYNSTVVGNWKLLSKGKLELDETYEKHLKNWASNSQGKLLGESERQLAEQEIMLQVEDKSSKPRVPLPTVAGEFGSIIRSYNKKLEEKQHKVESLVREELIDMEHMFGENSIPGTPLPEQVSQYTDTALLVTNIDLSKEKRMDVEKFRSTFLKSSLPKPSYEGNKDNEFRQKYMEWIKKHEEKSKYVSKDVRKIDIEITDNCFENHLEYDESEPILRENEDGNLYIFDEFKGYTSPYVIPDNIDKINIPPELKIKYKHFQVKDTVYDRNGDLIFRVPGLH